METMISKIQVIKGDCLEPDLGLSVADRKLITDNVSIIYHCAATIRFDEKLKKAVELNTRGTKLMIEMALECKKLDVSKPRRCKNKSESNFHSPDVRVHVNRLLSSPRKLFAGKAVRSTDGSPQNH